MDLKSKVSAVVDAPDEQLTRTTDVLFTTIVTHEVALTAAKAGHPDFSSAEIDTTAKALDDAANRKRAIAKRLRDAKKTRRRKRAALLAAQFVDARKCHLAASVSHASALQRFNAVWTLLDEPSTRQRTTAQRPPIEFTALQLAGEFGYSMPTLLEKTGLIEGPTIAELGDKPQALDSLLKALHRSADRKAPRRAR